MIKSVLSREDGIYKAFPDLVRLDDGSLICIYRESLAHGARPFGRIVSHVSRDNGLNWASKRVIHEIADSSVDGRLNNPRLLHLGGQRLLMICDLLPRDEAESHPDTEIFIWRSEDGGGSWSDMASTEITGHICPCIFRTRGGTIIIGADRVGPRGDSSVLWLHNAFSSTDEGGSWSDATLVATHADLRLNEGTLVELDDGTLVSYMREDEEKRCAWKSLSHDGGKTWDGPHPTFLSCCIGRPHGKLLRNGEVAIVHGFQRLTPPRNLVLHVETQAVAADPHCEVNVQDHQGGHRYFFIDHDRSIHCDGAYSGWVELGESGDLLVVQYINDDAPTAHIRSYRIERSDWILSDSLALHPPSKAGFHDAMLQCRRVAAVADV